MPDTTDSFSKTDFGKEIAAFEIIRQISLTWWKTNFDNKHSDISNRVTSNKSKQIEAGEKLIDYIASYKKPINACSKLIDLNPYKLLYYSCMVRQI